jgi:LPXTG-motif cell wall-anchored protein
MKKFKGSMKRVAMAVGGTLASAGSALAEGTLTLPTTVNTGDVYTLAGIVVAGLAGFWGLRKVVKFINRS